MKPHELIQGLVLRQPNTLPYQPYIDTAQALVYKKSSYQAASKTTVHKRTRQITKYPMIYDLLLYMMAPTVGAN